MNAIDLTKKYESSRKEATATIKKYKDYSKLHPKFKIGQVITFWAGYNKDIRYKAEIIGFDESKNIFLLWDAFWSPIKDDETRKIKLVNTFLKGKKSNTMATSKTTTTKKPKKRTSATSLCRKVIKVPGLNAKGQLMKGWHYVKGKPVKSKPATAKKKTTTAKTTTTKKRGLMKPKSTTAKKSAAQKKFAANAKKAAALVKSGKAKNISSAWKMLKN